MRYQSRSKYGNKKVYRYDRWFDSIAEADYYPIAVAYARKHEYELKLQERLDILPTLKINPWTIKNTVCGRLCVLRSRKACSTC